MTIAWQMKFAGNSRKKSRFLPYFFYCYLCQLLDFSGMNKKGWKV